MTPDPAAAAWLSECWKPCPELPIDDRLAKRKEDRREQRELEERAIHSSPEAVHSFVEEASPGCPDIASAESDKGAA